MPRFTVSSRSALYIAALAAVGLLFGLSIGRSPGGALAAFETYYDVCGSSATVTMTMTDGLENEQAIGMQAQKVLNFQCPVGRLSAHPAALVNVTVNSDSPWIFAGGELVFDGEMTADGNGTIGGTPNVHAVFHASITLAGHIEGDYTLTGLPDDPAVYHFDGEFFPGSPTPSPSPTQGPGQQAVWGNNNCSDGPPDPVDSLLTLRFDAGLSTNTGACPAMGVVVEVQNASPHPWGDIDCGGDVNPVDSLKLLRFDGGLSVTQEPGCPEVGTQVTLLINT